MKAIRTILVCLLAASAVFASAQHRRVRHYHYVPNNAAQLVAMQSDLKAAIHSMEIASPMYDGHRKKSLHDAHEALSLVDKVISGSKTVRKPATKPQKHAKTRKTTRSYTSDQITTSQSNMQQGMNSLQGASTAFLSAMNLQKSTKRSRRLGTLIQNAMNEATTAYNMRPRS